MSDVMRNESCYEEWVMLWGMSDVGILQHGGRHLLRRVNIVWSFLILATLELREIHENNVSWMYKKFGGSSDPCWVSFNEIEAEGTDVIYGDGDGWCIFWKVVYLSSCKTGRGVFFRYEMLICSIYHLSSVVFGLMFCMCQTLRDALQVVYKCCPLAALLLTTCPWAAAWMK